MTKKRRIVTAGLMLASLAAFILTMLVSASPNQDFIHDGQFASAQSQYWVKGEPSKYYLRQADEGSLASIEAPTYFPCTPVSGYFGPEYFYNVGKSKPFLNIGAVYGSIIYQQFDWPGGTFYYQALAWGDFDKGFLSIVPTNKAYAQIYLVSRSGENYTLVDNQPIPGDNWNTLRGSISLPAGDYQFYLGRGSSQTEDAALWYTDIFGGNYDLPVYNGKDFGCVDNLIETITPPVQQTTQIWNLTGTPPTTIPPSLTPTITTTGTQTTPTIGPHYYFVDATLENDNNVGGVCDPGDQIVGFKVYVSPPGGSYGNLYMGDPWATARYTYYDTNESWLFGSFDSSGLGSPYNICTEAGFCSSPGQVFAGMAGNSHRLSGGLLKCYGLENQLTPTVTPTLGTPSPSPTPDGCYVWNGDFEQGSTGWSLNATSHIALAGGQVGPQYLVVSGAWPDATIPFTWRNSELAYFQGFAKDVVVAKIKDVNSSEEYLLYSRALSTWTVVEVSIYLPKGNYVLELDTTLLPLNDDHFGSWDAVSISTHNPNNNVCRLQGTPTDGPTPFVTPTITPTYHGGSPWPSTPTKVKQSTASITPYRTWTVNPTRQTQTAIVTQFGTATSYPTITGTVTPGTPGPGPGGPTATPEEGLGLPPQEPPGGENADCIRPDNVINVPWWIDYEVCTVTSFVSWGQSNTDQITEAFQTFSDHEPFGTVKELSDGISAIKLVISKYDFSYAGLPGMTGNPVSSDITIGPGSIWNGSPISIQGDNTVYNIDCALPLEPVVGSQLSKSMCFIYDILDKKGLMPYFQLFVNMSCIGIGVLYIYRKFLDKAS